MKNRKALFFDIDGTLLTNDGKKFPKSAKEALRKAREKGHLVLINTGRSRCFLQDVEDKVEVDGFLCSCGTYIELEGKLAFHYILNAAKRLEIQKLIVEHDVDGTLEGTFSCFAQNNISRMKQVEYVKDMVARSGRLQYCDYTKEPLYFDKFCVLSDEKSDIRGFLTKIQPDLDYIDRGHGLFECVPAGFTKATAMEYVLRYYGIPREESYAFGDSTNDLAMLQYAGHAVVMGKHDKELEPYAAMITKNVEDDGIAYALEKLDII